jgi:DNA modification methylase
VYEPFSGSGTSLIAAETGGRVCFAMELDPAYVDVAVTRWEQLTGETAVLEGEGTSFAEAREGRGTASPAPSDDLG